MSVITHNDFTNEKVTEIANRTLRALCEAAIDVMDNDVSVTEMRRGQRLLTDYIVADDDGNVEFGRIDEQSDRRFTAGVGPDQPKNDADTAMYSIRLILKMFDKVLDALDE